MAYDAFLENAQTELDQLVVTGSDDELFASGYLQGHLSLVSGHYELEVEQPELAELKNRVQASLEQAIAKGELNEQDQQLVIGLWQRLCA
ncbi:YfcL family protein [Gallaecimonas sp. GXIMD4217]|uniref:YfcL family protein n=1 Tax=Gallaecimonas sp. GXIMD4217 TaxID=3131927 RepID=UPI00311AF349